MMDASTTPSYDSLEALAQALRQRFGQSAIFQTLNTRLIIQHGVNLKDVTPRQQQDVALLKRIKETLVRMGIRTEGGSK